jgi:hypothetical protein
LGNGIYQWNDRIGDIMEYKNEKNIGLALFALNNLTNKERLEVFEYFCTKCGVDKLKCECGWH